MKILYFTGTGNSLYIAKKYGTEINKESIIRKCRRMI